MRPRLGQSGAWIGLGGMVVVLFLYGYAAIAVPGWVTSVLLPAAWLALFALAVRWFPGRPYPALCLPAVACAVWFAVMLTR